MHTIRLRKPWDKSIAGVAGSQRVDVPDLGNGAAGPGAEGGSVRYARRFNRPSGLSNRTRVWLAIDGWEGRLERVTLNEEPVSGPEPADPGSQARHPPRAEFELTGSLQAHNRLEITLRSAESEPRLTGEIRLVIEEA